MTRDSQPVDAPPPAGPARPTTNTVSPERWLAEHGQALFAFACVRVRDRSAAEDLVQETFLAGLRAQRDFAGRSTERAWLLGILRNKIVDYYRRVGRESPVADPELVGDDPGGCFHEHGPGRDGWIPQLGPKAWNAPDRDLESKEFWDVFHRCASHLPQRIAQVFLLREMDGLDSEQICKELSVSPNNLWVMLHRARMALRRCLEVNWFERRPRRIE